MKPAVAQCEQLQLHVSPALLDARGTVTCHRSSKQLLETSSTLLPPVSQVPWQRVKAGTNPGLHLNASDYGADVQAAGGLSTAPQIASTTAFRLVTCVCRSDTVEVLALPLNAVSTSVFV